MSTQKRGRACEACSRIKTRCSLGTDPEASLPCERCLRLDKICTLTKPQRQKDRVQELEAKVAALTRLLQAQGITEPDTNPDDAVEGQNETPKTTESDKLPSPPAAQKKRRLETSLDEGRSSSASQSSPPQGLSGDKAGSLQSLDAIVPVHLQALCLSRYIDDYVRICPLVVPTGDCSFETMRANRPILLHAIIFAASPGLLFDQMQEDIGQALLHTLSHRSIVEGEKSIEIMQALLITTAWFRSPAKHKHLAAAQLIAIAEGMAIDIGIADPASARFSMAITAHGQDISTVEAAATFLVCHLMSTLLADLSRRATRTPWSAYHDTCLMFLHASGSTLPTYRWLIHYCRSERLCAQILKEIGLNDSTKVYDISDRDFQQQVQHCNVMISEWKILLPSTLYVPEILIWEHVATAYLHETLLHTTTNQQSFAAPFIADRLTALDFPRPVIREDHITSLFALRSALHNIIDLYAHMDTNKVMALPVLSYTSRALYALYMLLKLYVATTAPGNTYGSVLAPESLQLDTYCDKIMSLWKRLSQVDPRSGPARVTSAAVTLREYYINYLVSNPTIQSRTSFPSAATEMPVGDGVPAENMNMSTNSFDYDAIDWSLYFPLPLDDGDFFANEMDSIMTQGLMMPGISERNDLINL